MTVKRETSSSPARSPASPLDLNPGGQKGPDPRRNPGGQKGEGRPDTILQDRLARKSGGTAPEKASQP